MKEYDISLLMKLYSNEIEKLEISLEKYKEWNATHSIKEMYPSGLGVGHYLIFNNDRKSHLKDIIRRYEGFKKKLLDKTSEERLIFIDNCILEVKDYCDRYFSDAIYDAYKEYQDLVNILEELYSTRLAVNIQINFDKYVSQYNNIMISNEEFRGALPVVGE